MGILQEYRFHLIIAIIALGTVIALFFTLTNKDSYISYSTQVKQNDAIVAGLGEENYTLAKVISPDGEILAGTKDNSLFGLTLSGSIADLRIVDKANLSVVDDYQLSNSEYKLTYASTDEDINGVLSLDQINLAKNDILAIYTFSSDKKAQQVQEDYLPSSVLKDNSLYISLETGEDKDIDEIMYTLLYEITPGEILTSFISNGPSDGIAFAGIVTQPERNDILEEETPILLADDVTYSGISLRREPLKIDDIYFYEVTSGSSYYLDDNNRVYWKLETDMGNLDLGQPLHPDTTISARNIMANNERTTVFYSTVPSYGVVDFYSIDVVNLGITDPILLFSQNLNGSYHYASPEAEGRMNLVKQSVAGFGIFDTDTAAYHKFWGGYMGTYFITPNEEIAIMGKYSGLYVKDIDTNITDNAIRVLANVFPSNANPYVLSLDGEYVIYANSQDGQRLYMVPVADLYTIDPVTKKATTTNTYGTAITNVGASSIKIDVNGTIIYKSIVDSLEYILGS